MLRPGFLASYKMTKKLCYLLPVVKTGSTSNYITVDLMITLWAESTAIELLDPRIGMDEQRHVNQVENVTTCPGDLE